MVKLFVVVNLQAGFGQRNLLFGRVFRGKFHGRGQIFVVHYKRITFAAFGAVFERFFGIFGIQRRRVHYYQRLHRRRPAVGVRNVERRLKAGFAVGDGNGHRIDSACRRGAVGAGHGISVFHAFFDNGIAPGFADDEIELVVGSLSAAGQHKYRNKSAQRHNAA